MGEKGESGGKIWGKKNWRGFFGGREWRWEVEVGGSVFGGLGLGGVEVEMGGRGVGERMGEIGKDWKKKGQKRG